MSHYLICGSVLISKSGHQRGWGNVLIMCFLLISPLLYGCLLALGRVEIRQVPSEVPPTKIIDQTKVAVVSCAKDVHIGEVHIPEKVTIALRSVWVNLDSALSPRPVFPIWNNRFRAPIAQRLDGLQCFYRWRDRVSTSLRRPIYRPTPATELRNHLKRCTMPDISQGPYNLALVLIPSSIWCENGTLRSFKISKLLVHRLPLFFGISSVVNGSEGDDNSSECGPESGIGENLSPNPTDSHPDVRKGLLYAACGIICFYLGCGFIHGSAEAAKKHWYLGVAAIVVGIFFILAFIKLVDHSATLFDPRLLENSVPQKYLLTTNNYWGTVIAIRRTDMANILSTDKQIAVISALAEGSGIRQIERMTGVHRDTIMRLGVRVGQGCVDLLDSKMRGLSCQHLQFDEIWGFIGKKERHCTEQDNPELGDVWTFCAIDADTKLVPSFKVGKRDADTANAFVSDVAARMKNRVQISSDALRAYVEAVEGAFGADVDYAQIVKTYESDGSQNAERKYSPSEFIIAEKKAISGFPNMALASTSYVERLNGTTRLHMRRLTRLTYAFSKKLENFKAAVALHFAYYNFVKRHNTLRATPAMAAGIERDFWAVEDLVREAA